MRYGQIICDPSSEEAKALVGKMVVASSFWNRIHNSPEILFVGTLESVDEELSHPFVCVSKYTEDKFAFVREVIEEKPQYRPYKDTEEMVEDFKKRFCSHTTIPQFAMPLVWLQDKNSGNKSLIERFDTNCVWLSYGRYTFKELFDEFIYLDGSPVGKEVEE